MSNTINSANGAGAQQYASVLPAPKGVITRTGLSAKPCAWTVQNRNPKKSVANHCCEVLKSFVISCLQSLFQFSSVPTFFRGERAVEAQIPNVCQARLV